VCDYNIILVHVFVPFNSYAVCCSREYHALIFSQKYWNSSPSRLIALERVRRTLYALLSLTQLVVSYVRTWRICKWQVLVRNNITSLIIKVRDNFGEKGKIFGAHASGSTTWKHHVLSASIFRNFLCIYTSMEPRFLAAHSKCLSTPTDRTDLVLWGGLSLQFV